MKKIVIFFFSGTGNAKRIALWIHELAEKRGITCHLNNISNPKQYERSTAGEGALLVFISPIHGFNYPKITLDFIRNFPAGNNEVILMNTRAGMKIGNWITPGLTGIAFFLSAMWLRLKGYKIIGQIPYDMPSNWISLHPALREETVKYIHKAMNARVHDHFNKILSGERLFLSRKEIVQDVLIAPISLLYYFIGRFIIAKTFYATPQCDGCGICVKECPVSAIKWVDDKPFWTVHCESCMRCMNFCPRRAIETSHGLLALTAVLYSVVIGLIYRYVFNESALAGVLKFIISNLVFFVVLLLLYVLQHLCLKSPMLSKIIAYTSLTYYHWWGRYKSIADKVWKKE